MRSYKVADHFAVAAACRANPGEWQDVGEYNSSQSASSLAAVIRSAYSKTSLRSAYEPAGAFEARWALTEFGAAVQARYVGDAEDAAWIGAVAALTGGAA